MEISVVTVVICIVTVTTVTWGWRIVNWLWLRPKYLEKCLREQGLTGNSYRFFYGDLKDISMTKGQAKSKPIKISDDIVPRIIPFFHQTLKNYGKNSFTWIGPIPRVNIMNPEQIKVIFTKINDFHKPHTTPLSKLLAKGVISYEGEKWVKHRKIINPAFHVEKLKQMLPAFYESCDEMINQWKRLIPEEEGSCELDVWPYLENLTGDVISRTAFGSSYNEGKHLFQLQKEQAELSIKASYSVYVPGWRFIPTKMNKRMMEIEREVRGILKEMINKREKAMKGGEATKDDLLGLLLESNFREIQEFGNNKNAGMSIDDVIEECKLFYFAGAETTSTLLVWTMVLLSRNPTWQARAREEVFQVFGNKKLHFDGLNHLKVVNMILHEVLRLYPPVVMMIRTVHEEMKLGNLTIPAGVQVGLPTILVQHDYELWGEDAKEFNPERFSEGVSKATMGNLSFFPFGGGPKICIGQNFAMLEAKMALTLILQNFSFEISSSYAHAPFTVMILQPQFGAHIILRKL